MQATLSAVTPWYKTCSRCRKPTFEDLLDEEGLCDYCREVVAMKVSGKKAKKTTAAKGP
jgi:DNA-directed RNA polymerase subunit RPC12/RpoP